MWLKRLLGGLLVFLYACSSGAGGAGGAPGGSASCKTGCDKRIEAGCGGSDCEQSCTANRDQITQQFAGCISAYDSYLACIATQPVDCTGSSSPAACNAQEHAFFDCMSCGPATGGPQPGNSCAAADEGKESCWGCKAVLDCRYGDGIFLWRVKDDCESYGSSCELDSTNGNAYCY